MTPQNIIRAWKDEEYHLDLSEGERASLPAHPAGLTELTDPETVAVGGANAFDTLHILTLGCCPTGFPPCPPIGTEQLMTLGCCPVDLITV
jgi:mersacidin/lichenicidin family type 2 lantibiotic